MSKLRHIRGIKRGTPHVHACLWCARWKSDPKCTDTACDIVGETFDGELCGGYRRNCVSCTAEWNHTESLRALRAFGEAIAWVARARLIVRLMDQHSVFEKNPEGGATYSLNFWRGDEYDLSDSVVHLLRYTIEHPGRGELVEQWVGHPVDTAAIAVDRLLELRGAL